MKLKHSLALIELLSMVPDETLLELGLNPEEVEALDEVFDFACQHYEDVVGLKHPLEVDGGQIDKDMPELVVVPPKGAQH